MYDIDINHKNQGKVTYTVYRKNEAEDKGIDFKHWKKAQEGEYAISDDDYVSKVISKRTYTSDAGRDSVYMRFPWGYTFYNPKYSSKKLVVAGRKTNVTFTGKSYIEVQAGQDKMKNLAQMFALKPDYDLAIEWAIGAVTQSQRRKWKRTMKSEVFKKMVREELQNLLHEHGLTEKYTLDLLEDAIKVAKTKKDVPSMMRAVENLQDMHGMKEKYMEKTVDKIESKSISMIDDITKEESHIAASRTTTKELDE
tara:strand:+ start:1232 stop:1990 length:759 start_codon:yes stop_codon:yes gene_type:complete